MAEEGGNILLEIVQRSTNSSGYSVITQLNYPA